MDVELKTWKECIKINFHGQDVPYDMCCNARAVLKIESVYKQHKKYRPQAYVEECKYTDKGSHQYSTLSDSDDDDDDDDDGYFKRRHEHVYRKKRFLLPS